jgi:hypothetical protein
MKFNVIIKCKNFLEATKEKILEWYYFLIRRNDNRRNCLAEEYHISEAYACNEDVKEFLGTRIRNSLRNRYRIVIVATADNFGDRALPGETAIGIVRLCRREVIIDEATLIVKEGDRNGLVYWKFKK